MIEISAVDGKKRRGLRKPAIKFSTAHYFVVAKIIREIEDEIKRKEVCQIIGDGFNRRSQVFDFYQWRKACNT